jgi:hypothetical protein
MCACIAFVNAVRGFTGSQVLPPPLLLPQPMAKFLPRI